MPNPILQLLNRQNNIVDKFNKINQALSGQDPNKLYQDLMKNNPQFAQFVKDNEGKSPEQIAKDYGINIPGLFK